VIVLDTNVVSEVMRSNPEPAVLAWLDKHPQNEIFITSIAAAELLYGAARLPEGRRKTLLQAKIREVLDEDFDGRVLPFAVGAADPYARIVSDRERRGKPISIADGQIAAICSHYSLPLATRNTADFVGTGIDIVDPWNTPRQEE
jgi:toxin FitB